MDKLELKHIAPYLPYKLKFKTQQNYNFYGVRTDVKYLILEGIKGDMINFIGMWGFYSLHDFKPILRPLSDLTNKINYNDKIIIPVIKIAEDFGIKNCKIRTDNTFIHSDNINVYNSKDDNACEFWMSTNISNQYWFVMSRLFEFHFDVFGLIEKDLAIDINTL